MQRKLMATVAAVMLAAVKPVYAGEFYKLYPSWMDMLYHILLTFLIILCAFVGFLLFKNFKGGKLGMPWLIIICAFVVILIRSIMGILVVFDIQYFQALAFAGLDILFFILLLVGLILYKVGLE
jgi:hypothetical protein